MTTPASVPGPEASGIRKVSNLFLLEGIVLVILGILAVLIPVVATLAVTLLLGWLLAISGAVGLFASFSARQSPGFWWGIVSALVALAAGFVLIGWPLEGALSLTFVVIAFFIVEGISTIMLALEHRRELAGRWGFLLISGIVTLVLAAMILLGLPSTAAWAIGLLVGIDMIFGGVAMIAMATAARRAS